MNDKCFQYMCRHQPQGFRGDFILFYLFFKGQKGGREVILLLLFLKEGGQR